MLKNCEKSLMLGFSYKKAKWWQMNRSDRLNLKLFERVEIKIEWSLHMSIRIHQKIPLVKGSEIYKRTNRKTTPKRIPKTQ